MKWTRACDTNQCIEVAALHDSEGKPIKGSDVVMRTSTLVAAMILATRAEWDDFVIGVKAGKFDHI